jgi:hypothetical protein
MIKDSSSGIPESKGYRLGHRFLMFLTLFSG